MTETPTQTYVKSMVIGEMHRTHENNPDASAQDYIADLVRRLKTELLPEEGDADGKLRDAVRSRHALFCDTGAHAGTYALDLSGRIYLTPEECEALGVSR